ncbi:MAG: SDR family oxidoreductase [Porticoccaceae bacterium]|nr:SDR family oxidoreductase [Porticoccaceae bacterium]
MSDLSRIVLVTAGGSGIGLAIAKHFAAKGCRVHICDIAQQAIDDLKSELPDITATCADVSQVTQVDKVFDDLQRLYGGLDILVNNVGIAGPTAAVEDIRVEDWETTINIDLNSIFYVTRKAVPLLKKSKGNMINMSSNAGLFGCPLRSPYAAAKWAIIGLTKTWAMELGPYGVRVNAICPGSVNGPRIDRVIDLDAKTRGVSPQSIRDVYLRQNSLRVFVEAENIAETIDFLCSKAAQHITGQAIPIDGHTEGLSNWLD